ncbi:RidA family protein [Rickettsiales bacterium]|nr:RidA family protein [Rickettsiales bacterium]
MIEDRLKKLNIKIDKIPAPAANYLPYIKSGNQIFISGQLPMKNGEIAFKGKVGKNVTIEEAKEAARICAINIITNLKEACDGDLNKVKKCVKLGIFINAIDDFAQHPQIGNGASDLMVDIFAKKGKHSRFAVGVSSLPFNVPVEIDAIFEI